MRIIFDRVSDEYTYPIGNADIKRLKELIPPPIREKIRTIRFGCNTKTTQEGRTVQHGSVYDIRINFCLRGDKSLLLSTEKAYIEQLAKFGAKIDLSTKILKWELSRAKSYAIFILMHEVAHIAYQTTHQRTSFRMKSSTKEEEWCDDYATKMIELLQVI